MRREPSGRTVFWESTSSPPSGPHHEDGDEVWVTSDHTKRAIDALGSRTGSVSCRCRHPASAPTSFTRSMLGIRRTRRSSCELRLLLCVRRKNPLDTIEAYRRAFGPDDGAVLILSRSTATFACPTGGGPLHAADRPDHRHGRLPRRGPGTGRSSSATASSRCTARRGTGSPESTPWSSARRSSRPATPATRVHGLQELLSSRTTSSRSEPATTRTSRTRTGRSRGSTTQQHCCGCPR